MNPNDRITIRASKTTTIEFYRGKPRTYKIREADLPRLRHIFNSCTWPAFTYIGRNGLVEMEFAVSNREPVAIPDVEPAEEFFSPNIEPDPLESYWDYLETMNDFISDTRS